MAPVGIWTPVRQTIQPMILDASKVEYHKAEQVHTEDRSGMPIIYTGHGILPTPSKSVYLCNILQVSNVTKNLFCSKTHFHPNTMFVKDPHTKSTIIRRCQNGLYTPDVSLIQEALSSIKVSPVLWHSRLGHPSP